MMRTHISLVLPAVLLVTVPSLVRAQKGPQLFDVLASASTALTAYVQHLGAVAADEQYVQYDTSSGRMSTPKRLEARVVWVGASDGSVAGFRDVYAVDNKALGASADRLTDLFKTPATAVSQAAELSQASVRAYLSPNLQALDQPMLALAFLRKDNQDHSAFKLDGVKTMNGAQVAIVKFNEKGTPRLIPSSENAAAIGRFWIDVASGTVRQTELGLGGRQSNVRVGVTYKLDQATGLWLPSEMEQNVDVSGGTEGASDMGAASAGNSGHQSLEGRATYSNFRRVAGQ